MFVFFVYCEIWRVIKAWKKVLIYSIRWISRMDINIYAEFTWFCTCDPRNAYSLESNILFVYIHPLFSPITYTLFSNGFFLFLIKLVYFFTPKQFHRFIAMINENINFTTNGNILIDSVFMYFNLMSEKKLYGCCPKIK